MIVAYVLTDPTGDHLTTMAWMSIQTLRRLHPNATVVLWTDLESQESLESKPWRSFADCKLQMVAAEGETPMVRSRWIKTRLIQNMDSDFIYLDSDTLVIRELSELSSTEGEFGAAIDANKPEAPLMHSPGLRNFFDRVQWPVGDMPDYNSGVWIARNTPAVKRLGELWPKLWQEGHAHGVTMDQPSFWSALFQSGTQVTTLDPKWNSFVVHDPKRMPTAHVAHFWCSNSVRGTLLENLMTSAEETGKVDWQLLDRAIDIASPWQRNAEPWQYIKSGHYSRAMLAKLNQCCGKIVGAR